MTDAEKPPRHVVEHPPCPGMIDTDRAAYVSRITGELLQDPADFVGGWRYLGVPCTACDKTFTIETKP